MRQSLQRRSVLVTRLLVPGLLVSLALAGCQLSSPGRSTSSDSGPSRIPPGLLSQPDPVPRDEPLSRSGNALSYVVFGKRYNRLASARSFDETGVASWYGRKFHGRLTASGEPYDMYSMTAAHKSIPLPTYARVTNLANDRSVVVRINDRGPFVGSRLIDLSYAAAAKLDMLAAGTANVRVVALSGVPGEDNQQTQASVQIAAVEPSIPSFKKPYEEPRPVLSGPVSLPVSSPGEESGASGELLLLASPASQFLQIGAYGSFMAADELRTRMEGSVRGEVFVSKLPSGSLFRVRIGPFSSGAELAAARDILRDRHSINAIVVAPAEARSTCC